jgi:kynurenine formamidase
MHPSDIPLYEELPLIEKLDIRHSWDVLPASLGTLAFISDESVLRGVHSVKKGEVVSLNLSIGEFNPPLFGRAAHGLKTFESSRNTFEDLIDDFNPQSSSQWDGLLHIRAREFGFYSGITDVDEAQTVLGIHHVAKHAITGRGVLIDVPQWREKIGVSWDPFSGECIEVEEIIQIMSANAIEPLPGDILCIRTGWLAKYRLATSRGEELPDSGARFSGIASHHAMASFLWNNNFAAICSDNPAVESAPGDAKNGSLHRRLIPGLGFAMAELLDFDLLAEKCLKRNSVSFQFVAAPLTLVGGASSTANSVALL